MLVSDGQPTVGMTSDFELSQLVGRVHDEAITLTALGVGADIDGALMLHLAERGGGMYGYLKDAGALEEILGREVTAARSAFARNVELRLAPTGLSIVEVPGRHLEWDNGQPVLHLADLRPHTPTRVLVRLNSVHASPGDFVRLGAAVTWRTLEGQFQRSEVAFNTAVVEENELVKRSRDEAVFSRGVGALASQKLVAATTAWERGDTATASSLLDNARALFGMSADALAGDTEVATMRKQFATLSGATEKRDYARKVERKKLSHFGLENSGY